MGWTPPGASTWGGGYRIKLFSLANKDGKNFTFVGTRSNGPTTVDGKTFPKSHEGTSGISIEDLQKNVVEKGALTGSAVKPHIILLHIGTNNMYGSHSAKPEVLIEPLLDRIIKDCPDALLVVAKIVPYSGVDSFNAALPAIVDKRAKAGAHIILIDLNKGFPSGGIASDGVHPNETGYTFMADGWYKAISSYLH
jgi:lysophospholipase L1-like esterase